MSLSLVTTLKQMYVCMPSCSNKAYFKPCYVLPPKPIKQRSPKCQTTAFHTSRAVQLFPMPKVNGCLLSYRPTLRHGRTGFANHAQTPHWVINTSARLPSSSSFLLHRGELGLHSVNLSLQARLLFTLARWRTEEGNERGVVKDESG